MAKAQGPPKMQVPASSRDEDHQQEVPMTYNFDPDRWYENQRALLERRRARGEIDAEQFEKELERLGEQYERMLQRLDGPFEVPGRTRPDDQS